MQASCVCTDHASPFVPQSLPQYCYVDSDAAGWSPGWFSAFFSHPMRSFLGQLSQDALLSTTHLFGLPVPPDRVLPPCVACARRIASRSRLPRFQGNHTLPRHRSPRHGAVQGLERGLHVVGADSRDDAPGRRAFWCRASPLPAAVPLRPDVVRDGSDRCQ